MKSEKTLLEILVDELPNLGGWPDKCYQITQDSSLVAYGSSCSIDEIKFQSSDWRLNASREVSLSLTRLATDYKTSIVTKDSYSYAIKPKKKYEYEAVSGDQSLFDIVNAYDFHTMIVRYKGCIYSTDINAATDEVIAERKVKEVKLPVVGDKYNCLYANPHICTVVYLNDKYVTVEFDDGSCSSKKMEDFFYEHTIIDQSKQTNPVNMAEDKWVPKVGDNFFCGKYGYKFKCIHIAFGLITAWSKEGNITEVFDPLSSTFRKA